LYNKYVSISEKQIGKRKKYKLEKQNNILRQNLINAIYIDAVKIYKVNKCYVKIIYIYKIKF